MDQLVTTFNDRIDIPSSLHDACKNCIHRAREKYRGFTSDSAMYYEDGFGVNCNFIPPDEVFLPSQARKSFSPEDFEYINNYSSALLWGEANLLNPDNGKPWTAWSYQRASLLCKCPRKVYRFGRRCLPAGTLILLADGNQKPIEDILPGEHVVSWDGALEDVSGQVLNSWNNGEREVYKISLSNGMSLDCTSNHPLLVWNRDSSKKEWQSIDEGLSVGAQVSTWKEGLVPIQSIEEMGTFETFDLEINNTHNFVSNGIYTHNTGKCLTKDSDIQLADGSIEKIGSLIGQEIEINAFNQETYEYVKSKAFVHDNGIKSCVRITTSYGNQIECTLNHPLLTCTGWKSIDMGLKIGDRIGVPVNNPNVGVRTFDKKQLNLLGYLLGDESLRGDKENVKFFVSVRRNDVKDNFLSLLDGTYHIDSNVHTGCYEIALHTNNSIVRLIQESGLTNKTSHTKFIPDFVFQLDREHLIEFLWPLFTTDGWADNQGNIGYVSASRDLALGIKRILSRLGIVSLFRAKTLKSGKYRENRYYAVEINNNSEVIKFLDIIGLRFKGYEGNPAEKWANYFPDLFHKEKIILDSDIFWDKITSIESIGEVPTAGLEVPDYQTYVNDVVEHNTTILSVEILWFLFTSAGGTLRDPDTKKIRQNLKVLLLTPQKSHIENIFDRIRAFLNLSPALSSCIDRNKRGSPQIISLQTDGKLGGGNMVSGYASGDSSGNKGLAARGQDADLVVLDEGAFVSKEVIENVINPILYTRPTTRFIISSTPSGIANDYFESICTKRPDFAEFYVPATFHPKWPEMEDQVKKDFGSSQEEWDKEVLAKFSPAGIGVYREDLVKLAQEPYSYGELHGASEYLYTFGVDWNKEHGTEIVIVATQRKSPHFSRSVWAENIPKKEFTTPSGIGRIVELNRIWLPSWIYVDAGGGDGSQMLRYHGRAMAGKHPLDARLMNIVKAYDFSSKVEFQEHNGQRVKAHAKQFMVENSVKRFELGAIKYPRDDISLTRQLNSYIIARRTPVGIPVYGMKEKKWGDHRLDALNLALVAVRLEFPSFFNESLSPLGNPIAIIPNRDAPPPVSRVILPRSVGIRHPGLAHQRAWLTDREVMERKGWGEEPPSTHGRISMGSRSRMFRK